MKEDACCEASDLAPAPWLASHPSPLISLRLAHLAVRRSFREAFADLDLTPLNYTIMDTLSRRGRLRQAELINAVGSLGTSLAEPIDELVARGWVSRQPDQADRRSNTVALTDRGHDVFKTLKGRHDVLMASMLGFVSLEVQEQLLGFLEQLSVSA